MKALVQRVENASVSVQGRCVSSIDGGLVCYLGIKKGDGTKELDWLARKVANLRVFSDSEGRMNLSAKQLDKSILVISQFTLYGSIKNGYRPGFSEAEEPQLANQMYEAFCEKLRQEGISMVEKGVFGADMTILQTNNGPVTLMIETPKVS